MAGGYKMYTKPQHHDVVRRFIKSLRPPLRLTMPALETLAVISYKQPVTAPEIQEIRGVNTSGVMKTLLDKRLITTAGRKEVIGRPILYRTSKEFLMRFGLSDLQELPSLKEFEALAREALGTDEGIATPGAGDESVLDGMTQGTAAEGESARRSRHSGRKVVQMLHHNQARSSRSPSNDAAAAEEVSTARRKIYARACVAGTGERRRRRFTPNREPEPSEEFAETIEEKSHKACGRRVDRSA